MPLSTPHLSVNPEGPQSQGRSAAPEPNWTPMLRPELQPLACIREVKADSQRSDQHSALVTRLGRHFDFTNEDCHATSERMRQRGWVDSWRIVEAAAMAWCRSVKPHYMHLGPREPFYPQDRLHNATTALLAALREPLLLQNRMWFVEAINDLHADAQTWLEKLPNVPSEPPLPLPWPLSQRVWLSATPDLDGRPRPILVQTVEATAPQAGEALLLTRPGETPWSVSVVGPAISLELDRPEDRWAAAALNYTGMAWSEWIPPITDPA